MAAVVLALRVFDPAASGQEENHKERQRQRSDHDGSSQEYRRENAEQFEEEAGVAAMIDADPVVRSGTTITNHILKHLIKVGTLYFWMINRTSFLGELIEGPAGTEKRDY